MSRKRSWRHRFWQVAVVAIGVIAATEIRDARPTYEQSVASFVRHGTPDEPAGLDGIDVTVLGVEGAKTLGAGRLLRPTEGVWVLVTVRLDAGSTPAAIGWAAVVDADGHTYDASNRFSQPMLTIRVQPGVPVEGQIAFEVPASTAATLHLRAARSTQLRLDAVVDIPLGITPADVEAWTVADTKLSLADREVVG